MRVILHIGAGKSGSSAIQRFLGRNSGALAEQGFAVVPTDLRAGGAISGQQVFALQAFVGMASHEARAQLNARFAELVTDAEARGSHTLLVSAENLSNPVPWNEIFADVCSQHRVEVVFYIRRQDEFVLSAWQQWGLKSGHSFETWVDANTGLYSPSVTFNSDWKVPIEMWRKLDLDRFVVRLYESGRLVDNDVVRDFVEQLDPLDQSRLDFDQRFVNHSYSLAAEELAIASGNLSAGVHDANFFNFLDRFGMGSERKVRGESRLGADERHAMFERYRASNTWIKSEYFSDDHSVPPMLFRSPLDDEIQVPTDRELSQKALGIVAEVLVNLSQFVDQSLNESKRGTRIFRALYMRKVGVADPKTDNLVALLGKANDPKLLDNVAHLLRVDGDVETAEIAKSRADELRASAQDS